MEQTIPLTFVRDRVKAFYKIKDTESDSYIDLMILDSVRDMQSYKYTIMQNAVLDICDFKAELPCNYKIIIAVLLPYKDGCVPVAYTDIIIDGCECHSLSDRFMIQGNTLVFPSNFEHDCVQIAYQGFLLDDEGFPILIKDHLTYYERYAKYHVGLFLEDARYKAFSNFKQARKNIIHNEKADQFELQKFSIEAINRSVGNTRINFAPRYNLLGDGRQQR